MQSAFYELAEEAKKHGAAVFLSSHDLAEVRKMCDRIGFIRDGELVSEQTIADMAASAAHRFDIVFAGDPPLGELKKIHGATIKSLNKRSVNIKLEGDLQQLFEVLAKHKVLALDKHELNLEEQFLNLYENPVETDK